MMKNQPQFIFRKENYILMLIGVIVIAFGFLLMLGNGANTNPEGNFDPNYFNEDIFSFRRIRLAPIVIIIGFVIEIFAILKKPSKLEE
ncbi:MAG: DUF3098 domain-containing protein [Flavobacteriales bacterium]